MASEEEEVAMEVEAVQAVYGDDCVVLDSYPPHLHLHIKPRTADVSSQQFVEAVIAIRAGHKYPKEPPLVSLIDSKGLDQQRQNHLISSILDKAFELSSCVMLVELCEEAVERLTVMNHPDGDCPLCLYPLVREDGQSKVLPFMKLMSCFHCFHSECIIRWWKWLHIEKETDAKSSSTKSLCLPRHLGNREVDESLGRCSVCRKVFHAKDLEHVLELVGAHSSEPESNATEGDEREELLQSDSERIRREEFEAILKCQQEKGGLIEAKKNIAVVAGMFLPQPVTSPSTLSKEGAEQKEQESTGPAEETNTSGSSNKAGSSQHHKVNRRKQRGGGDTRRQGRQWVQKK